MAVFTDYYKFERLAVKSKSRLDCTSSTRTYEDLEEKRATKAIKETDKRDCTDVGALVIYYNDVPPQFTCSHQRRADKSISIKGRNLSSVYVPDPNSNICYGDFNGTTDAIIFVLRDFEVINGVIQEGSILEMFIARGQNANKRALYNLVAEGDLEEEMSSLRLCAD
ncbi:MAG: hypothetical protein IKT74_05735 [Bacteroidales bacterium]|nr:hypothetical protein [Bacteroidales bacterium]